MASRRPKPVDKRVGKRIRTQRQALGLTIQKLADALGIAYRQLHKYEMGTDRVSASRLQQIAVALKVTPVFFFDQAVPIQRGAGTEMSARIKEFASSRQGIALARAFVQIADTKVRRRIVALVERIARL
jgi:transcriptional regulator with XRE-family HTH domain